MAYFQVLAIFILPPLFLLALFVPREVWRWFFQRDDPIDWATTLYLWLVDRVALACGTWSINPAQTTGLKVGVIPIEETLFFFMINLIIGLGITLILSPTSQARARAWSERFSHRRLAQRTGVPAATRFWTLAVLAWLGVMIATPIAIWALENPAFPGVATLGVLVQFAAVLMALSLGWPRRRLIQMLLVGLSFTWLVEFIGVRTGLLFGRYSYTALFQPQVGGVPVLIPLAWMMMLAPAWAVAEMILQDWRARLGRWYPLIFASLAALAFTAWDLYLDPQMVARGLWVWESPQGYFGIPWMNFLGWWLCAAALTFLLRPADLPRQPLFVIYVLTWIFQAIGLGIFWGQPGPALVGFLGMGSLAAWAWFREGRKWSSILGERRTQPTTASIYPDLPL